MKQLITLLFLAIPTFLYAQQANFEDGFDDGDFTNNPTWQGTTDDFTVTQITSNDPSFQDNFVLRLDADEAGTSYLSTPSSNVVGYWEFFIRLDFAPSNNNRSYIYLMSDIEDLTGDVNGYALRAGENGAEDVFRLFKITDGAEDTEILTGTTKIDQGGEFRVKVTRTEDGEWTLEVGEGYNASLNLDDTGTDNSITSAEYFGFTANYTASNRSSFYYDFKIRKLPFNAISSQVIGNNEIEVVFNKDIDQSSALADNFELNPGGSNPSSVTFPAANSINLEFSNNFEGGENNLTITGVKDAIDEVAIEDTTLTFFIYDALESGDVVVNEIMYDQPTGTPEYVELKNTTAKYLNLKNWKIGNDRTITEITTQDLVLHPDSFIVFTRDPGSLTETHGAGYYIDFALPQLRNSGDEVLVFDSSDAMVDSVKYEQSWGGTKIALERRSATASSNIPENWGDSPSPTLGTPGKENLIEVDDTPPELEDALVIDNKEIHLVFDEAVDKNSAENTDNYTLTLGVSPQNGSPNITEANLINNNTVQLLFEPGLPTNGEGNPHKITVQQIEDIFGNLSQNLEIEFKVIEYSAYEDGDVVVNEIMYDQPSGTPEYVELKNNSSKYLNLKGWELGNDRTITKITNNDLTLAPDDFIVFTTDPNTLIEIHGEGNYVSFALPALRNAGDQVRLYNEEGSVVDSLEYSPDWGGKKVALERIDSRLPSTIKANWGDSPNPNYGTPGKENEIQPDTEKPKLLTKEFIDAKTVKLKFSKAIDEQSAVNHSNYTIQPNVSIQNLSVDGDELTVGFAQALNEGDVYLLTINNLADIFGNQADVLEIELRYLEFTAPTSGDVVINEILYLREEADDPQFVEIYNISDKNIDLGGWIIRDAASTRGVIPSASHLAPGEYIVLTDREYFADNADNIIYVPNFPSLNRAGDAVALITPEATTVDSLNYSSEWGGAAGVSIERKDPFAASNDASNWATSTDETGATPGRKNSRYKEDNEPPKVIFASQQDNGVFVAFSEFIALGQDTEFKINGSIITNVDFDANEGNKIFLHSNSPKLKGENETLEISNLYDFKGNKTANASQPIALPISPGTVVINELLFEAHADPNDNLPDQAQYLELYNPNDYAISLEGLVLTKAPDETGKVTIIEPVSSDFKWIPAKEYMLVYAENETTEFENSKTAIYFELENEIEQFSMRVNRTNLSLRATGDDIYIADSTGTVIDSVKYSREWHNPNKITTKGTSLEKINPAGPSDDPSNWSSSADSRGGTPGAQNSIYQQPSEETGKSGISFSSNPFSPDNDGFEDNLIISYELNHSDYLLHVRIFDRYGRKVRTLADGKPAGYNGNLIWDGLTDNKKENRVGIYIVLFEAYNSAAGKKQVFKETVVLARQF